MTTWTVHADKKTSTCTLTCRCGGCGRPAAVVMRQETYLRLVRDPDMPLGNLAGSRTLRTGNHWYCDRKAA
jgi:hypothetical protein